MNLLMNNEILIEVVRDKFANYGIENSLDYLNQSLSSSKIFG